MTLFGAASYTAESLHAIGQVAQLVERGPEKAGVGGSIPSLATNIFNNLAIAKKRVRISRAYNTRTSVWLTFTFGVARSNNFPHSPGPAACSCDVLPRQLRISSIILIFELGLVSHTIDSIGVSYDRPGATAFGTSGLDRSCR